MYDDMLKEFRRNCNFCKEQRSSKCFTCNDEIHLKNVPINVIDFLRTTNTMLDLLSDNIFWDLKFGVFGNQTQSTVSQIANSLLFSCKKALRDIALMLNNHSFNNVSAVIRKFYDDLLLVLFIIKAKLDKNDKQTKVFMSGDFGSCVDTVIDKVLDAFLDNSLLDDKKKQKKEYKENFSASAFQRYLDESAELQECYKKFFEANKEKVRRFLDNRIHSNGAGFTIEQYEYQDKELATIYKNIFFILQYIVNRFLSYLILLHPLSIMSSAYIDSLDCDIEPEEGSQYWILPAVQNYITAYMKKELRAYLKDNNKYSMQIED